MNKGRNPKARGKKSFPKNRGRKPNTKAAAKYSKDDELLDQKDNDPIWYVYDGNIVDGAGSLNYFQPLGIPYLRNYKLTPDGEDLSETVPTLAAIYYTPTLGCLKDGVKAPVNIQARSMYSQMQSTVSMKLPFNAADIAIHLGAVDSLYIMYEYAKRIIGLYTTYNMMDRAIPDTYMRAFGFDPVSWENQLSMASFIHRFNKFAVDLRRIWIPDGMAIFKRHRWLNERIFLDSQSIKAQQYVFIPTGVWEFDGEYFSGGSLVWKPLPSHLTSDGWRPQWSQGLYSLILFMEEMLSNVTNDMDMYELNAYILKAFAQRGFIQATTINSDYQTPIDYSGELLTQIHNMAVVGEPDANNEQDPWRIVQDEYDSIVWNPVTIQPWHAPVDMSTKFLIDMPFNDPSPLENLVATRLMVGGYGGAGVNTFTITSHGSEFVNQIMILEGAGPNAKETLFFTMSVGTGDNGTAQSMSWGRLHELIAPVAKLSHFQMHPMIYLTNENWIGTSKTDPKWYDVISDLTNYTTITFDDLDKLHDAAISGEWFVPKDVPMTK